VNAPRGASQRHRSLESRLEIERLTSGLEGGCWKSAQSSSSLAAYPTSRSVPRGLGGSNPAWLLGDRFVKKQQMSWSRRGAHLLLHVRTRVLNEELRGKFESWYPELGGNSEERARTT
jgi:hypothetical protein